MGHRAQLIPALSLYIRGTGYGMPIIVCLLKQNILTVRTSYHFEFEITTKKPYFCKRESHVVPITFLFYYIHPHSSSTYLRCLHLQYACHCYLLMELQPCYLEHCS